MKQLRRVAPFAYIKTLTRTAGGRPIVAIQLGCGCTKVLVTGTHHANESITGTLLWELLLAYCRAICNGGTFGGKSARALYRNSMLYCVPLVNPDGADLVAGAIPEASPEYVQAAAIAAGFPQIPFPDGWKANLRGVDLNLNYPASWELAKEIKGSLGFDRAAPRDFPGKKPLDQRETAALAAYTACIRPDILLAYHTQGRVIYPGGQDIDPPGAEALAEKFSEASGYTVEEVPQKASNAGFKDWFLRRFHRPGFTIEAGLGENPLPLSQLPQLIRENEPLLAAALAD
ncbi:MAG: M14 family metallocarboxypeptidase [Oscillospiraceae bacterium]